MRVLIIGAGVAGGVIGRELRACPDVTVTLIDKVAADDHVMAGNGLNVGPNAIKILQQLMPEVAAELHAASLPWTRWKAMLVDGTPLFEIPLDAVADTTGVRIRWSDLYRIARQPVADLTLYERRCVGVRYDGGNRITATIESIPDGRIEEIGDIDLIIGCDGRYSVVRESLVGEPPIRHIGISNFRLLIEDDGRSDVGDLAEWYHGPNRLLAFRLVDGRVYLSGNMPIAAGGEISSHQKSVAGIREAYLPQDGSALPVCRMLVDATCAQIDTLHWSRAQEIPSLFRDARGHALLVGDSAHAMVPTLGQGATQALEDAGAFVGLFRAVRRRGPVDIPAFTAAFDRLRRERINFVKSISWDASAALQPGGSPVRDNAHKTTAAYWDDLRRLYRDVPFATADQAMA